MFLVAIGSAQYAVSVRSFPVHGPFEYGSYLHEMSHQAPNVPHFLSPSALVLTLQMFARHWVNLKCSSAALCWFLRSDDVLLRPCQPFADLAIALWFAACLAGRWSNSVVLHSVHDLHQRFHNNRAVAIVSPAPSV